MHHIDDISLLSVGQITKSYGVDGDIIIRLFVEIPNEKKEPVFIYFDELPVPFFISKIELRGKNQAVVRLIDIDSYAKAEELVGKKLFLDSNYLSEVSTEEELEIADLLIGATLLNDEKKVVGKICDYYDYPNNPCIEVQLAADGRKALAPFNEELIIEFNDKKRELTLHIADGILDI